MDFRTNINIPKSDFSFSHQSKLMVFGSCFSENIGQQLFRSKFDVNVNPFGILYNPASIAQVLRRVMLNDPFSERDLFSHNGLYHSMLHHGDYSNVDAELCLNNINESLGKASADLLKSDCLLITFGTAFVYRFAETGNVVSNCHKLPASSFTRDRLSVHEILNEWVVLIKELRLENPTLKILFTVSPIRHWKDGAHENQLSKSTLLLAIDQIRKQVGDVLYFPSYEIVLDELRDYRFYADDMVHPSSSAVNYIWERFRETYFDEETESVLSQWNKIAQAIAHRPINKGTESHKYFLRQTLLKLEEFQYKYPYFVCTEEEKILKDQLI